MMNEALHLTTAIFAGGLLGTIFFGGLWWTIHRGMTSRYAALWFTGSLVIRLSITLSGFYLVGHDHWQRLLVCLAGFVIARIIVTSWANSPMPLHSTSPAEIHNAP